MEPNEIHQTIAGQLDHVKPDEYVPGKDVGMAPVDETTLKVVVFPDETETRITYDRGRDLYDVEQRELGSQFPGETVTGMYCDQLGEAVFGERAKEFTMPMVQISTDDGETWEVIG